MGVTVGRERRRVAIVLACVVLVTTGCGRGGDVDGSDRVIIDPVGRLDQNARQAIEQARVPDRHALVVAVESFDASEPLGPQADAAVDRLSEQCDSERRCDRRGIYVLLDADNGFPQLRVGSSLRLSAMWEGATYGPEYVAAQRAVAGLPPSQQAATFVPYSVDAVLEASEHRSWFERWSDNAATPGGYGDFATEFMADSYPESGYYDHWLVRPLLHVQAFERRHLGTWFISIALSCAGLLLLTRLLRAFARRFPQPWVRWPGFVMFIAVAVLAALIAVPISAAMVLQSGARLEDAADVQRAFGDLPELKFWAEAWAPARNLLLSAAVLVVGVLRGGIGVIQMLGPSGLVSTSTKDKMLDADLVGEWRTFVSDQATDDHFLFRQFVVPVLVGVAGFNVLPAALVVAVLMGWLVEVSVKVFEAVDTRRAAAFFERLFAHGDPTPPKLPSMTARIVTGCLGIVAAAVIGLVASRGPVPAQASAPARAPTVATVAPTTTSVIPPFVPETGEWSLMPMVAKDAAAEGAEGDPIRYLQGVLRLAAGQPVEITGTFDASTVEAVRAVQSFMSLEPTGVVDAGTWLVIDQLAQTVAPQPAGP